VTRHLALVGPTATGKSAIALEIARAMGDIEIVSLDSMQVYREMNIGTAKPTREELAEVPHHLVDVADPSEPWSVARTQELARAAIASIEARGKRAILVGGTGLYVQAVVDGLTLPGEHLPTRDALLAATDDTAGLAAAYARLRALDPEAAARTEPGNRRRIVRALEVIETSGRPFSSFGPGIQAYGPPLLAVTLVGCWVPRAVLAERIAERFAAMAAAGLLDEVRALATRPAGIAHTAEQAIGYREVLAFLRGELPSAAAAFDLAVRRTRQFARRQRMWFRRDPRIRWVAAEKLATRNPAVLATWTGSVPAPTP
jgi:tRNA dimethylallyltransferase